MSDAFKVFISKIEDEFDDISKSSIEPNSIIADFIEVNSLNILVISTVYEFEYNLVVPFEKIKAAKTFQDLFELTTL